MRVAMLISRVKVCKGGNGGRGGAGAGAVVGAVVVVVVVWLLTVAEVVVLLKLQTLIPGMLGSSFPESDPLKAACTMTFAKLKVLLLAWGQTWACTL